MQLNAPFLAPRAADEAAHFSIDAVLKPCPSALVKSAAVFLLAGLIDIALSLFLYLRPSPSGAPFALDASHYVFHAMLYGVWGQLLLALPFLIHARIAGHRRTPFALGLQVAATTALLALGALDREVQRFLGMHASSSWLSTYASVDRTPQVIFDALARDRGGAWSSLWGLAAALSLTILAPLVTSRVRLSWLKQRTVKLSFVALLVVPTVFWNWVPGGKLRQSKVAPALLLLVRALRAPKTVEVDPARLAHDVATVRQHLASRQAGTGWKFTDPQYPLRKHHVGPLPEAARVGPSFIVLQLETFRAKDMKSMNPDLSGPAPTPFLDGLAAHPHSAFWQRYYASGVPTVHAFMALHTSLYMHPSRSIASEATVDFIEGFPGLLREHGYRTIHFTGSDPDWDSQRAWLNRWYDEVHFAPEDKERDRLTFRRAARRIREVGEAGKPFLAYLSSISNHTPFTLPDSEPAMSQGTTTIDALHNTMHYTDDVVRELYTTLSTEPWFDNVIWIIVGDHGFDLGDRGACGGHTNLRHETTWVPLIVHGADPRLPRGPQSCVASHVDVAPTILELASVWNDNSFVGTSLLHADCARSDALVIRGDGYAYETPAYSLFQPEEGKPFVYAGDDLTQVHPLDRFPQDLSRTSSELAEAYRSVIRYVVDHDRIAPRPAVARAMQ